MMYGEAGAASIQTRCPGRHPSIVKLSAENMSGYLALDIAGFKPRCRLDGLLFGLPAYADVQLFLPDGHHFRPVLAAESFKLIPRKQ